MPILRWLMASNSSARTALASAGGGTARITGLNGRIAYMIFTGPRSSFMVWNAGVFFLAVSQRPSGYSRIN